MSHIVSIQTRIKDSGALAAACRRLGWPEPQSGTAQLYTGEASGLIVRLPGWRYPAVVDTDSGNIRFDNFEGLWGEPAELDKLLQAYAVEKARIEARRAGHHLTEHALCDGSIKLTIQMGPVSGGAA